MSALGSLLRGITPREVPGRAPREGRPFPIWPLFLLALPAFVAIWAGWVSLGQMCGFGDVDMLPGIGHGWRLNTAITLPIGMETYAAYALRAWLSGGVPEVARKFARASTIGALTAGAAGQITYHVLAAAHRTSAPWPVVVLVSCVPVVVLGMGAALAHLIRSEPDRNDDQGDALDAELRELTSGTLPEAPVSPAPQDRTPGECVADAEIWHRAGMTWAECAGRLGVTERTLYQWRKAVSG